MVYCITHAPSLDYITTLSMVMCMMIMSVGSWILLLHHIYSSTSELGDMYGLLYYSCTLSRLHNHPLYGHVYDDHVMKKHVLCNFCGCTLYISRL